MNQIKYRKLNIMKNILNSSFGTEILNLDIPNSLGLRLLNMSKKFGLDKVLIINNDGIEIVSKYKAEYHKNRFTGRYNKTNILNGDWLKVDAEYNGLQVIDLRQ